LYDRAVAITGTFPTEREIYAELIFRGSYNRAQPFGFGVSPLWGAKPENHAKCPRDGWNFALTWYHSKYAAAL
jgi:hypothetical protein